MNDELGWIVVGARRSISATPREVFELLTDLERHWPLLGADLIEADLVNGESAALLLRGPVPGLERKVITRVVESRPYEVFRGEAHAGDTLAMIEWQLSEDGGPGSADVTFRARIKPGGLRDRALVNAARPWLSRRCGQVLDRLDAELAGGGTASE
ncbi:MAG: SRPBCC family protein [Solirubrobacterales bacterium]